MIITKTPFLKWLINTFFDLALVVTFANEEARMELSE